jgi:hypothetical protein
MPAGAYPAHRRRERLHQALPVPTRPPGNLPRNHGHAHRRPAGESTPPLLPVPNATLNHARLALASLAFASAVRTRSGVIGNR